MRIQFTMEGDPLPMKTHFSKHLFLLFLCGTFLLPVIPVGVWAQSEPDHPQAKEIAVEMSDDKEKKQPKENVDCDISDTYCIELKKINTSIGEVLNDRKYGSWYRDLTLGSLYERRAELFYSKKQYAKAIADYNRAIDDHKRMSHKAITQRAELLLLTGKSGEAFKEFDSLLGRRVADANAFLGRGKIYFSRREYDKAFEDFDSAINLNHRLPDAYFGRGVIYLKRGERLRLERDEFKAMQAFRNALDDLDSVLEINLAKTSPETYRMLARVCEAMGNLIEAEKYRTVADETDKELQASKTTSEDPEN